jgi:hypothetical protein
MRISLLVLRERKRTRVGSNVAAPPKAREEVDLDKDIAISPIFCHQLDLVTRWNLWGAGPVLVGKEGAFQEPEELCDPTGMVALNPELLFDVSAAEANLMEYFEQSLLNEDGVPTAEIEKGVSLRKTTIKVKDQ